MSVRVNVHLSSVFNIMKNAILLIVSLLLISGCKTIQNKTYKNTSSINIEETAGNKISEEKNKNLPTRNKPKPHNIYPLHRHIKTTYFYIGEKSGYRSGVIDNGSSAWTKDWVKAYGGVDDPRKRDGYFPSDFVPKENPFYCALPFNDINRHGHKKGLEKIIPWKEELDRKNNGEFISYCKNRWVKITYKGRVCYAQWEDVGPFETDDPDYVFGMARPKNKKNGGVGLDISPACFKYLKMKDNDYTDWQFVDFEDVPDGPWLRYITISNPRW